MGKVCVFFADGTEEVEALTVVDIVRRAGIDLDMVGIDGKREITSSHNVVIKMDKTIEEVDFDAVDMIVLPGGMPGMLNLDACELLTEKIKEFDEKKKYLSAICASPSVLGHKGVLKGRNACCYPGFEKELLGADVRTDKTYEISDHIITSRGMGCAIDFSLAIVARLKGEEVAADISKKIVYNC